MLIKLAIGCALAMAAASAGHTHQSGGAAPSAASPSATTYANHLANANSPYLLMHAHNPVDWYPWGEEALCASIGRPRTDPNRVHFNICSHRHIPVWAACDRRGEDLRTRWHSRDDDIEKIRYLVVGEIGSRDWIHSNYGRKIEDACELRAQGANLSIICEKHWAGFVRP